MASSLLYVLTERHRLNMDVYDVRHSIDGWMTVVEQLLAELVTTVSNSCAHSLYVNLRVVCKRHLRFLAKVIVAALADHSGR